MGDTSAFVDASRPIDRRRFVQGAGLALAATSPLLLAACGDDADSSTEVDEANDLKIVQAGRARELSLVAAYEKILTLVAPENKASIERVLAQEQTHAEGLATVIQDLGGTPVAPKSAAQYDADLRLDALRGETQAVDLGNRLENQAVSQYIHEIPKLTISDLRSTWTSLATSESQHKSILLGIRSNGNLSLISPDALVPVDFKPGEGEL